jgi:cytochrome c biogenesis factor
MNFMGQVCLVYTVAFGIAASLITWFVYPMLERSFSLMNRDIFRVVFVVCCVLFIVIFATYNVDPPDFLAIDFSSQSVMQESSSSSAG